jgi:hypothetical protein
MIQLFGLALMVGMFFWMGWKRALTLFFLLLVIRILFPL